MNSARIEPKESKLPSGISRDGRLINPPGFPVLTSFWYIRRATPSCTLDAILRRQPRLSILLDCGAYSAFTKKQEVSLDAYMEFCWKEQRNLWGYAALDVVKNPVRTLENYRLMLKQGLRPFPVHTHGNTERDMDEMFESAPMVMCGGLFGGQLATRHHVGQPDQVAQIVKQRMVWAKGRPIHWFGLGDESLIRALKPYSVDTSTWSGGIRYGRLQIYLGRGRWFFLEPEVWFKEGREKDMHTKVPPEAWRVLNAEGFGEADLLDRERWRRWSRNDRVLNLIMNVKSAIRHSLEFREEFGILFFLAQSSHHSASSAILWKAIESYVDKCMK